MTKGDAHEQGTGDAQLDRANPDLADGESQNRHQGEHGDRIGGFVTAEEEFG